MSTSTTATREILRVTRELVAEPEHWVQGTYRTDEGGYCLLGAVDAAWIRLGAHTALNAYDSALTALRDCLHPSNYGIVEFNDHPGRTHQEILALLDCALEKM